MVLLALGMNLLSLGMIQVALALPAGSSEQQEALQRVLGMSGCRMFGSIIAYVVSQWIDIQLYAVIKRWTGPQWLWLRNNGSTSVAQMVDTILVDLIFLGWGLKMTFIDMAPIMLFSYLYKVVFNLALTPLFYALVFAVKGRKINRQKGDIL